jgi:hypothetical protein
MPSVRTFRHVLAQLRHPTRVVSPITGPPQLAVIGFMIAGDLSDYLIGLIVEREFSSQASLIVFLALYFLFLWLSWLFAVRMTEPKSGAPAARR